MLGGLGLPERGRMEKRGGEVTSDRKGVRCKIAVNKGLETKMRVEDAVWAGKKKPAPSSPGKNLLWVSKRERSQLQRS